MDALIQQQLPLILAEAAQWAATYEKWTLGYLMECLEYGYPNGPLEKEAAAVAARMCAEG